MDPKKYQLWRSLLDRRQFLSQTGGVFDIGLMGLLGQQNLLGSSGENKTRLGQNKSRHPCPRRGHFQGKAKQVLIVYCPGAVIHLDTFTKTTTLNFTAKNRIQL